MGDWTPCDACSPQHFAESCGQVVMIVAWPHQFAEGETIQLTDAPPVRQRESHTTGCSRISYISRKVIGLLPRSRD